MTHYPAHWDAQRVAEFQAAQSRVTHREPGTLPFGMQAGEQLHGVHPGPHKPTVVITGGIWAEMAEHLLEAAHHALKRNKVATIQRASYSTVSERLYGGIEPYRATV